MFHLKSLYRIRFFPKYGMYGVWPNASPTGPPRRKTTRRVRAIGATEPRGGRVRIFHLGSTARRTEVRSCERGDVDRRLLVADVTVAETVVATFASPEGGASNEAKRSPSAARGKPCTCWGSTRSLRKLRDPSVQPAPVVIPRQRAVPVDG